MDKNKSILPLAILLGEIARRRVIVAVPFSAGSAAKTEGLNVIGPDIEVELGLS